MNITKKDEELRKLKLELNLTIREAEGSLLDAKVLKIDAKVNKLAKEITVYMMKKK